MSKRIFISEDFKEECLIDFKKMLETMKVSDGKIAFSKVLTYAKRNANLYFDIVAWKKMKSLINTFSTEVAWHGIAERLGDEENDEYLIKDILVYPQVVTGAHVDTDQAEYEKWLIELSDDEFNHMRMQGHSHVNMAVNPSGVDIKNQNDLLSNLRPDDFYIFMIWNKSGKSEICIYDYKKNVLFENADISVDIYDPANTDVDAFITKAKEIVAEQKPKPVQSNYSSNVGSCSSGYSKRKPRKTPAEIDKMKKGKGEKNNKNNSGYSYYGEDYDDWGYYDKFGNYHYYSGN